MICERCKKEIKNSLSQSARDTLEFMKVQAPKRGGYIFEGARSAHERGEYHDNDLKELLDAKLIGPHPDPAKGYIVL